MGARPHERLVVARHGHGDEAHGDGAGFLCRRESSVSGVSSLSLTLSHMSCRGGRGFAAGCARCMCVEVCSRCGAPGVYRLHVRRRMGRTGQLGAGAGAGTYASSPWRATGQDSGGGGGVGGRSDGDCVGRALRRCSTRIDGGRRRVNVGGCFAGGSCARASALAVRSRPTTRCCEDWKGRGVRMSFWGSRS